MLIELSSIIEPVKLQDLFPVDQPVEIELGAGDGGFLITWAKLRRDQNFIGVERLLGRLRKLDRKIERHGLTNVRGLRIEASYFIQYLLPPQTISALHIYFPDPWPKRKHWRHRLVNEAFPSLAESVLKPGGTVYLRTDHTAYFEQMQQAFNLHPGFTPSPTPSELIAVTTDFEKEFLAMGIAVHHAAFTRCRGRATTVTRNS